ncbi:MAG: tetratricopeptide repeat protein [Gemmatimonadales bacterium]|jgi:tetratricopeptide (TPR) repeat protein
MDARPDRQVARAKERLDAGDAYGAIHLLREVVATGKAFADAHHLLGLAYAMVGQREEALAEFDRALALNPRYVDAHLNRAVTLNDLGRSDEATAAFAAAQGLGAVDHTGFSAPVASQLANLHAELGEAYVEAGGIAQAIVQFEAAAALRPEFLDLRYRLARLRLGEGDAAGARQDLEAILAARPGYDAARASLGLACYLEGDREAARAAWEACRARTPGDPKVVAYLALLERVGA